LETVEDRVVYLEQFSARWTRFQAQLDELRNWTHHSAPTLLEQLQATELTPEERVKKSQALQAQLEDKINVLDVLSGEVKELLQGRKNQWESKK
jgi:hypothetical protein